MIIDSALLIHHRFQFDFSSICVRNIDIGIIVSTIDFCIFDVNIIVVSIVDVRTIDVPTQSLIQQHPDIDVGRQRIFHQISLLRAVPLCQQLLVIIAGCRLVGDQQNVTVWTCLSSLELN